MAPRVDGTGLGAPPSGTPVPTRSVGDAPALKWVGPDRLLAVLVLFGAALLAVEVVFWVGAGIPALLVLVQNLTVAVYLAVGAVAWRRRPNNDIGLLLVATGFVMWLSGLQQAPMPALAAVGAVTATLPLAMTLHLVLAYPSGRVRGPAARTLVTLGYLASTVLQAPFYLVGDGPLALTNTPSARELMPFAQDLQTLVGVSGMLGAAVLVAAQALRSGPAARRRLGPMVWYRVVAPAVIGLAAVTKRLPELPNLGEIVFGVQALAIGGLPVAFGIGLLSGSFGRAGELGEMVARIGTRAPTPQQLSQAIATALGDKDAVVVYATDDGNGKFVDASGRPVAEGADETRVFHEVRYAGRLVGGIWHHTGLTASDAQLDVLSGIVAMAIDQQRLVTQERALLESLRRSEEDLRRSRRRLLRAEDAERRRIARDLHDGAQQHLVLLGMDARLLSLRASDPAVRDSAAAIADRVTDVLIEFRDIVSGIMPVPLQDRGLGPAVELLALQMPVPTKVTTGPAVGRLREEVESTLYFVVSEALTNVMKYAEATLVDVDIEAVTDPQGRRAVRVSVVDNGTGCADPTGGTGLRGLADRVSALGGSLAVQGRPGEGSTVEALVPCD